MDSKISDLTLVTALDGADVLPIVNGGNTKKVTVTKIKEGLATTTYVDTQDNLKVDKVTGKGLSTEDYTTTEKSKLAGIASGAEVNVNADWNSVFGDSQILNKPTIPNAVTQTSQLTNNGADGVNPFITALDIPVAGQASTLVREVKNMTGATLTKGTVVYISGANGNKALVSKALATTDELSSRTFGMLQSDILNNGLGNCVIIGDLTGVNTSAFAEGAQLYLSGVTAGTFTQTKILAPTHLVYVGKVTSVHPTQGQIEVGIQNGYELSEIHDVAISTPINNDALVYETATGLWKNKEIIINDSDFATTENTYSSDYINQSLNGLLETSSFSFRANNTNVTAVGQSQVFKDQAEQNYTGTITWSTTAPTTILNNTYRWQRVGSIVTVQFNFNYSVAASNTQVTFTLPTDMPTPENVSGFISASEIIAYGNGMMFSSTTAFPTTSRVALLRRNATNNGYEFVIAQATASSIKTVHLTLIYFA